MKDDGEKNKKPPSFVQDENKCQNFGKDFNPAKWSQLLVCPGVTATPEVLMKINSVSCSFLTTSSICTMGEGGGVLSAAYIPCEWTTNAKVSNLGSNFFCPFTEVHSQE